MTDFPRYTIKPNVLRKVIPQLITTAALCAVFYLGIYINIYLLEIFIPPNVKNLIFVVLGLLVVVQGLLSYIQISKIRYSVYDNRVQMESSNPQYAMFNSIQEIKIMRNAFDKIFNTGTVVIYPGLKIEAIPNVDQVSDYLKQMMQYTRTQYV